MSGGCGDWGGKGVKKDWKNKRNKVFELNGLPPGLCLNVKKKKNVLFVVVVVGSSAKFEFCGWIPFLNNDWLIDWLIDSCTYEIRKKFNECYAMFT